ncbi:MAG TPA: SCO5389 family protein [Pseudonocardiaceae bacterium]|nr:SCO5389 family protein [Pseudonocardiaceae bacterium]
MSLDVPTALLERAELGDVSDEEFVAVVRSSLPYAWHVISQVSTEQTEQHKQDGTVEFTEHAAPPPTEADRGQLLRALASDAIRSSLERHFGVKLAFQNCHRVAAFNQSSVDSNAYQVFVSPRGQLLNQSPELRNC